MDSQEMGEFPDVVVGRPRVPLLLGQQLYIEQAYTQLGLSQARIAQDARVAIPRVRRHLVDKGLYSPRPPTRTIARAKVVEEAIEWYSRGEKVVDICTILEINPAELYRALRENHIPFRMKSKQYAHL